MGMSEQSWVRFFDVNDLVTHWHLEAERDEMQSMFTVACGRSFHVYDDERFEQMNNVPADTDEACPRCLETTMAASA